MNDRSSCKGSRCPVCTGCGRCANNIKELKVMTDSFLPVAGRSPFHAGETAFVLADIGTTTIAVELFDASGKKLSEAVCANPQREYGADVVSRIRAAEDLSQLARMQRMVREVLETGVDQCIRGVNLQNRAEALQKLDIGNIYISANTTMAYLFRGLDPSELGKAPFQASHLSIAYDRIAGIPTVILPGLSAFVGGDIMAGVLACGLHRQQEIRLLIDLGTNGEMVLGNCDRMIGCSTAAGPAFEGMSVWGADMIKYIAALLREGYADDTGLLAESYFEEGIMVGGVRITQDMIRSIQTAKAAVYTGILMLQQEYGLDSLEEVDTVYLAGGFGFFLDPEDAMEIGLLPESFRGKVKAVGNTALAGAYYCAMNPEWQQETAQILKLTQTGNLAEMRGFERIFVDNMYLIPRE